MFCQGTAEPDFIHENFFMSKDTILIAGGGPVGMVAAACLATEGFPVTLVEAEPRLTTELRASTFHPPTLDMMDRFGVTPRLIEAGLIAPTWQFRDRKEGAVATFDLGMLEKDTAHPYRVQCEQWRLVHFLHDVIKDLPNFEMLLGHKAVGAEQNGEGVTLQLETREGKSELTGKYLIAADGARSDLRRALGIDFEGYTLPEMFLVLTTPFPFEEHLPDLTFINYISDPDEWLVLLKVRDLWRTLLPTFPEESEEDLLSEPAIQARLQNIVAKSGDYQVEHRTLYKIHQRVAASYRAGRIFLVGDSAHINNPLGGMGMNGGIHDAVNLTDKLMAVARGAPEDLLERYERQRRTVAVENVQAQTNRNRELLNAKDPEVRKGHLDEMRKTSETPELAYPFLLRTSMIESLRRSDSIA